MEKLFLICVDDQREVLTAVVRDLQPLAELVFIEECESAGECEELMEEIHDAGDHLAVVVSDHVMPGGSGVDLLKKIAGDNRFPHCKKVLLTGLATQNDTIVAVNQARIHHYFDKPWNAEELVAVVRGLITEYLFDAHLETRHLLPLLDKTVLYQRLSTGVS